MSGGSTLLLLLLTSAFHVTSAVEAVLLIYDDSKHTFYDVATALEHLGLPPPAALLLTTEVNDGGLDIVSKGTVAEMELAASQLSAFNVSVQRTSQIDAAVVRTTPQPLKHAKFGADSLEQCPMWALAGACTRQPLAMHLHCASSCTLLGPRFVAAARTRAAPSLLHVVMIPLVLLVASLLFGSFLVSEDFLEHRGRHAAGMQLASSLLLLDFVVGALRMLVFAQERCSLSTFPEMRALLPPTDCPGCFSSEICVC